MVLSNKTNTYDDSYVVGFGLNISLNKSVPLNGSRDVGVEVRNSLREEQGDGW